MTDLELLDCILDKPIAYYKVFFHVTQDAKTALFLSQLYYWSKKMNHDWFYKTIESWEEETGLNRREQETIKKKLVSLGLLETKRKNVPATLHFKFNFSHFITLAKQYYSQIGRKCQTSMAESANLDCTKVPNLIGRKCQSITENNTEITTEKEIDTNVSIVGQKPNPVQRENIPYAEIIDYLNQKAGTSYRADSKENRSLIRARWMAGYRLEDFKKVIDGRCDVWLTDPDMCQYLRPSTLFRPSKFENYLQTVVPKSKSIWD